MERGSTPSVPGSTRTRTPVSTPGCTSGSLSAQDLQKAKQAIKLLGSLVSSASSSGSQDPSTSVSQDPSTSVSQGPSTSVSQGPSTSVSQGPSTAEDDRSKRKFDIKTYRMSLNRRHAYLPTKILLIAGQTYIEPMHHGQFKVHQLPKCGI